jgi:pumilio RNA-binding family
VKQKAGNVKGGRGVKNAPGSDRDDPVSLTTNPDACKWAMSRLEHAVPSEQYAIISWLHPATLQLALSEHGCRVVQKVFDVAGGEARAALSDQLRGHVLDMLYSPHGNHVLQKFVEVMPSCAMQFVLDELEVYKGGWATLAKHKFGCRIEQRILEHCPERMTSGLVEAIVQNAGTLFMHKFGNYVVQSVLEHAVDAQRCRVVDALIQEGVSVLAQDRVASNVLERALHHCNPEFQQKIVLSLTQVPGALYEAASDRYGVFVVRQMLSVVEGSLRDEVFEQLQGLPELTQYEIPMTSDEFGQMKELPDMCEYEIPKTMDYFPDNLMPVYEIPKTMELFPEMILGA